MVIPRLQLVWFSYSLQLRKNKDAKGSPHSLLGFNDGEWRWSAGVQGGLAGALPLAAFTLTEHQSLGLIASLGAFTVLHGSTLGVGDRLRALPLVAMGFVTASVLGVLCSTNVWLSIACLVTVAAVACIIVFGVGLGPPGLMQFVLVAGISGHLAALKRLSVPWSDFFAVPALVAAGAFGAYLIVVVLLALPLMRKAEGEADRLRASFLPI